MVGNNDAISMPSEEQQQAGMVTFLCSWRAHNAHCITELFPALAEPPYLPYGALSAFAVNSNSFPSPQSLYSMGSCCCTAC